MSLDRLFDSIDGLRNTAVVGMAFGEPQEVEGKVIISVAEVGMGFGLGFGQSMAAIATPEEVEEPAPEGQSGGGGGGGGSNARPIAIIEITPQETVVKPIEDETRITLAGIVMVAWCVFWLMATLRAIFGKH